MTKQKYRFFTVLPLLALTILISAWQHAPRVAQGEVKPKWEIDLPAAECPTRELGTNCHTSSPALADVNGDGGLDIVLATNNGHVLAVEGDGRVLWDTDIAPSFGLDAGFQSISSSPAVADLDGDGKPEVVVGAGSLQSDRCIPGGVIVLDSQGEPRPGWPKSTYDNEIPPQDCPDPVYSTPALGDLDGDGDLEIVVGAFDTRVYAWHHDGSPVDGFPPPSKFYLEQGWEGMASRLADTVWSSPALADLDGDGYLDVVIGTDEGMIGPQPDGSTWDCPYATPPGATNDYCGGTLYAWDRHGDPLAGYPKRILEIIQSSPAVADANYDGAPEVFVGAGSYYHNNSPDHPEYGFHLFAWGADGGVPLGWGGGQPTDGTVNASPVVGDIAGDIRPEIIVPSMDGKLYAWHANGVRVGGFPMTPRNLFGSPGNYDFGKSPILADYDGDGKMEIFLTIGWSVAVVDGNGAMLTSTDANGQDKPYYYGDAPYLNNPAAGDIDGDGSLELVVHNSKLTVWDLPAAAREASWPMFRHDPARTGVVTSDPALKVKPHEIEAVWMKGDLPEERAAVTLHVSGMGYKWQAEVDSAHLSLPQSSGSALGEQAVEVVITVPPHLRPGVHAMGHVVVTVTGDFGEIRDAQQQVPVTLLVLRQQGEVFAPLITGGP